MHKTTGNPMDFVDAIIHETMTLHDADCALGHRKPKTKTGKATKNAPPLASVPSENFFVLSQGDGLFFTIPARIVDAASCVDANAATGLTTAVIAQRFHEAFNSVWNGIPEPDRATLLTYWRGPRAGVLYASVQRPLPPTQRRPAIIISDDTIPPEPEKVCAVLGQLLFFPVALVLGSSATLRWFIARALTYVYRQATGEYERLAQRLIHRPLESWLAKHGKTATDAAEARKHTAVERKYRRHDEAAIAEVLRRWGVEDQQSLTS